MRNGLGVWLSVLCLSAMVALPAGCDSGPKQKPRKPNTVIVKDTPAVLRDCILAQATLRGTEPILVSGYGLVVGLNNTGGGDAPGAIRAVMEREMLVMGVGKEIGPFKNMSPNDILNDKRTAVVIVSAAIPPGAPVGTRFDVRVEALPGTATTSLEGGRLYTTRLFRGLVRPAMPATEPMANAKGDLFINPFADPAKAGKDTVYRTVGRIMNGGVVNKPLPVTLTLDTPSHARTRAIMDSINSRFPRATGEGAVARGLNEETLEINVPRAYRSDSGEFFSLLQHVRVDRTFPEEAAIQYAKALKEQPEIAESLSWALQALGPIALPQTKGLYDYPEIRPRMAAITAGAKLGDITTRPHLEEVALRGPPGLRPGAIRLLGILPSDPKVNEFLRDQLNSRELDLRIAAYEALARRADPWIERTRVDDKFVIDVVPSAEPMVYATLQNEPRIVVFGEGLKVRRPVFVSVWEDRLMVSAQSESDPLKVFYKDFRTGRSVQVETPAFMTNLVEYLAHQSTPEAPAPGLNLSYSEVVGALATMLSKGIAAAPFVPETDRLELELIRARQTESGSDRPEVGDETSVATSEPDTAGGVAGADRPESSEAASAEVPETAPTQPPAGLKKSYVVPLPQAPQKPKDSRTPR
ncbi:MAG: flagellar basal body P-ring protein FlgI [Phycisphaerae bacterium]|nr:flagellar basal body P-ring protein FlgI [Phycisphaerae bacterium]